MRDQVMVTQFNVLEIDALQEVRQPAAVVDPDADGSVGRPAAAVHGGSS